MRTPYFDSDNYPAFKEYIQRNPDVCSNCGTQIQETVEVNHVPRWHTWNQMDEEARAEAPEYAVKTLDEKSHTRRFSIEENTTTKEAGEGANAHVATICECGAETPDDTFNRPLHGVELSQFFRRCKLYITQSTNISIDEETAIDRFDELKSRPDMQDRTDELVGLAIQAGIKDE